MARVGKSRGSQLLKQWRTEDRHQVDVAEWLGLDAATYNRFERGVRKPAADVGFKIEQLTDGIVYAKSWYEPPLAEDRKSKRARAA